MTILGYVVVCRDSPLREVVTCWANSSAESDAESVSCPGPVLSTKKICEEALKEAYSHFPDKSYSVATVTIE